MPSGRSNKVCLYLVTTAGTDGENCILARARVCAHNR